MSSGNSVRKGPWYEEEDERLRAFVAILGEKRWDSLAKASGLRRSRKSCRLRWLNYLRPCLKQGPITLAEERLIIQLHEKWGNKWADIARRLPGRTDNEIKNYWRTLVRKKIYMQNNNDNTNSSSEETSCSSYQTNCTSTSNSCQDASSLECNTKVEVINDANHNVKGVSVNDVVETETGFYHDRHWKGESEYTVTSSPYENRLSDWMSSLSSEQCDSMSSSDVYVWENNGFDYSCDWSHCEDTLWDVDLFNLNHMS